MRMALKAGMATAAAWTAIVLGGPANAQELSDKSVETLLEYAWNLTPDRFTKPDGGVIEVDKKDPTKVRIPVDTAREVIKAGRLTAHAQNCGLNDEHIANHRVFMASERDKNKWTEQQMLFMNQLHLATAMLLTGKLKVIETDTGKDVTVAEDSKTDFKGSCTEEQKAKVREAIVAFIKQHPNVAPQVANPGAAGTAAGGPAPSTQAAAPGGAPKAAPAAQKK